MKKRTNNSKSARDTLIILAYACTSLGLQYNSFLIYMTVPNQANTLVDL